MNKNLTHIIMTPEYLEHKLKGLEYLRGLTTITEQISEIEAELNASKSIKIKDKVKKTEIKDWIKTLKLEKKNILQNEKKQNKALSDKLDENKQLKEELKKLRKEKKETADKLLYAKYNQSIKYKRDRATLIKQLKEKKKQLQTSLKTHPHIVSLRQVREKKKQEKLISKQSNNYNDLQYEYKKLKSAFNDKSTEWLILKKLNENDKKHDIIFYVDYYESNEEQEEKLKTKKNKNFN